MATKKFPWQPVGGVQNIDVSTESVVVGQVVFDMGSTLKGTPLRKSSANVRVRIDNNSEVDEEVGVAVVVFDAEGNVVAAGSNGTKWGYLNKGSRTYYDIDFPYVYRRLDNAANFIVTLETRAKGTKSSKPTSDAPAPEPTPVPLTAFRTVFPPRPAALIGFAGGGNMIMRKAALFAAAVCLAAPLPAQQATKKFDYKPVDGIQTISLAIDQVKVSQIVFKPGKAVGGPVRRSDAECVIRIDNDGPVAVQTGVAVALFDEAGNLVAAGSAARGPAGSGRRARHQRDPVSVRLPQHGKGEDVPRDARGAAQGSQGRARRPRPPTRSGVEQAGHVAPGVARHLDVRAAGDRAPVPRSLDAAGAFPVGHARRLLRDQLLIRDQRRDRRLELERGDRERPRRPGRRPRNGARPRPTGA